MAYEKQFWIDRLVTDDTKEVIREGNLLEAKRFNHMEDGIGDCSLAIEAIQNVTSPIAESGYVVSVKFIEDEMERRLEFVSSNGSVLSVPLGNVTYQVNYYEGSTLLFSDVVEAGQNSIFSLIPTRESTAQYDYTFLGWSSTEDGDVEEGVQNGISHNVNLYAIFDAALRSYMITFMLDDQVLFEDEIEYGEVPLFSGNDLVSEDGRPFDRWIPELGNVIGPVNYTASFKHKISYYDGNTLLKTEYVGDGENPEGYTPTKTSTAQYSYTFKGWTTIKNSTTPMEDALSAMGEDRVVYAIFSSTVRTYTVTWSIDGTTQTSVYSYGVTPTPPTVGNNAAGRKFSGWDKTVTSVTGNTTYTARYQRMVRFYNGSTLLQTKYVDYGTSTSYTGTTPTKASSSGTTYTFSGWASSSSGSASSTILTNITADKDVYAVFTSSTKTYTVKFYNGSSLLQSKTVTHGGTASYTGSTPTKTSTAQYSYSFSGWASSDGGSASSSILTNITADKSVYAAFSATTRSYTITWSMDGTTQTSTYQYGATPTAPTVANNSAGRKFSSWDKTITTVTGATTYTARYQRQVKFYNGTTLLTTQYVDYGKNITYSGSTPTKASTAQYSYSFSGWASSSTGSVSSTILNSITADKSVYAIFTSSTRSYSVKFYNGSTLLQTKSVAYGSNASYTGSTPTKDSTAQYSYSFSGWASSNGGSASSTILNNITGDKSVYAAFTSSTRSYSVKFYNGSTLLETKTVSYGNNASYTGTTPTKASTTTLTYSFSGWASSSTGTASSTILNNITGDKSVYAVFTSATRYYSVKFYNGSTLLQTKSVTYNSNASYTGSTPTKSSTAQYTYTFSGWASSSSGSASSTILNNITADKSVYAVFSSTTRKYTISFVLKARTDINGSFVLINSSNKTTELESLTYPYTLYTTSVAYGSTPTYNGPRHGKMGTTLYSAASNFSWTPSITTVTGSTTYYAK